MDSLRHLLNREKSFSISFKEMHMNFFTYYTDLIRLRTSPEGKNSKQIKDEINKSVTVSKSWLLEKFDELGK